MKSCWIAFWIILFSSNWSVWKYWSNVMISINCCRLTWSDLLVKIKQSLAVGEIQLYWKRSVDCNALMWSIWSNRSIDWDLSNPVELQWVTRFRCFDVIDLRIGCVIVEIATNRCDRSAEVDRLRSNNCNDWGDCDESIWSVSWDRSVAFEGLQELRRMRRFDMIGQLRSIDCVRRSAIDL